MIQLLLPLVALQQLSNLVVNRVARAHVSVEPALVAAGPSVRRIPRPSIKCHGSRDSWTDGKKVAVCGGAGGIGQPLAMLMTMAEGVKEVCVQDVTMAAVPAPGVAADISHLEFPCKVSSYAVDPAKPAVDQLDECLKGCDVVIIPAGVPRKPGMTRDDLFTVNAGIAKGLLEACAEHCPEAMVGVITNPVNSILPAVCELYKQKGLDPRKIIGVTTLDVVRANRFVGEITGVDPRSINVPVIGGHAGKTILPLFSQDKSGRKVPVDQIASLDERTQNAGTEVVQKKAGAGSATLSMAYAGARLAKSIVSGLRGKKVEECAYVMSDVTELPYFSSKVTFGKKGVEKVAGLGQLSDHEQARLEEVKEQLKVDIEKGLDFISKGR